MRFWAFIYVLGTGLLLFKSEQGSIMNSRVSGNPSESENSANSHAQVLSPAKAIVKGYKTLWGIISLPAVRSFALILLSFKFGFSAYDAVAPLKLLEKGFPKEFLALTVLIDFPFQMAMGFLVAKWSAGPRTFRPVSQKQCFKTVFYIN